MTGTVNLGSPAASGGQAVNLTASDPAISIPASVLVPEGQTSSTFRVDSRTVAQGHEPLITANVYSSSAGLSFDLVPSDFYATDTLWEDCGPMDLALIMDVTLSMGISLSVLRTYASNIINAIEFASGGDYRLALVSVDDFIRVQERFAPTNRASFIEKLNNLPIYQSENALEKSEEAINTVMNALPAANRPQIGDFDTPFRSHVRKLIVIVTDQGPSPLTNDIPYNPQAAAHSRAAEAYLKGVQLVALVPPAHDAGAERVYRDLAVEVGRDYGETSRGFFAMVDPPYNVTGQLTNIHLFLQFAVSQCGTTMGELVHVREDDRRLNYSGIFLNNTTRETNASEFATFDLTAISGEVRAAHLNRTGQLRVNYGSHFDVQVGASSVVTNVCSFGSVVTNAHAFPVGCTYKADWELPFSLYPEIEAHEGGQYFLKLSDRVSAACGNNFEVVDVPNADWPLERNFLSLRTAGRFEIPQGRCRDFVLVGTNAPSRDTWQVLRLGEVIACSCEPYGWSVERDYSIYSGFNICVPTNAVPMSGYEIRHKDALGTNSGMFAVLPQGALDLAPVLRPIVMDPPFGSSNTVVNVTIELDAPARGDGAFVTLQASGITNSLVPAYVHIPAGQVSAKFGIPLPRFTSGADFDITAFYNGYRKGFGRLIADSGSAPDIPQNFRVQTETDSIRLTWDADPTALFYEITRGHIDCFELSGSPVTVASRLTTTCFVDYGVAVGSNYCYAVRAYNEYGSAATLPCNPTNSQINCAGPTGRLFWPEIIPPGGKFNEYVWVTITNASPGSSIYFTLDGTDPTTNSIRHTNSFVLTTNTTVVARSFNASGSSTNTRVDFYVSRAIEIACGTNVTGSLGPTNWPSTIRGAGYPVQRYKFQGIRGYVTTIYMESPEIAPFLYLVDPSTNVVAIGDPTGRADLIRQTLRTNGTYYIEATTVEQHAEGAFSMYIECNVSPELDALDGTLPIANGGVFDFGITPTNTTLNKTLTISNSGTATLVVSNFSTSLPVFSVSPATPQVIATNAFVNLTLSFLSQATGAFSGTLTFNSNDGDNEDGVANPFVLSLLARANPSGTAPTVTISTPATNQVVQAPTNQPLTATVVVGSSAISQVDFYVIGSTGRVLVGSDTSSPYSVNWANFTGGVYQVRAEVIDAVGRWNQSAPVQFIVNDPPIARNDRLGVLAYSWQEPLPVLANDTDANKDPLSVYSFTQPSHGVITNINGVLHYTSLDSFIGVDSFNYTVSDGRGGTSNAVVTVPIIPYDPPPVFVRITVPPEDIELTGPTNIIGTVTNDYLYVWDLKYFRVGRYGRGWVTFASGTDAVTNGLLGTFDPTLLPNGIYKVKLVAVDFVGNATETQPLLFKVGEGPKVGHFTLSFSDLEIPVAGLPITLTRSYDSRATEPGDFGAGWKLDVSSVNLQKSGVLGEGWQLQTNFLQGCVTDSGDPHVIAVNFPDKTYRFGTALQLNYQSSPCTVLNGLSAAEAKMVYPPFAGTVGTLDVLRGPVSLDINILGGGDEITLHENRGDVDDVFGPIYDPTEFVYTHLDGSRYEFNPAGQIVKMADRNGNTLTFGAGGIIHSTGKSVKFIRDTSGRIVEIYDPLGLNTSGEPSGLPAIMYRYAAAGNLSEVHRLVDRTQPDGYLVTKFAYEDSRQPHFITSIKDPRGITGIRNEYDGNGRLVASVDASGKRITYTHDLNGRKEVIVDRLGFTNTFSYDAKGNVTNSVNALGHTNSYTFDSNNNKTSETNPKGETIQYTYDANNLLLSVSTAAGMSTLTYNKFGQIIATVDALGRGETNGYDSVGNLIAATNALGAITSYTYDPSGNVRSLTDALGNLTTNLYDSVGSLTNIVVKNAAGQVLSAIACQYDINGNRTNQISTRSLPSGGTTNEATTYVYDAQNRITQTVTPDGKTNTVIYNPIGKQSSAFDKLGRETRYEYDDHGHPFRVTYPDLTAETYGYDSEGRRTSQTNRLGHVTRFVHDALGRAVQTIFPDNTTNATMYDAAGQVAFTVDGRGTTNAFGYDSAGRRVAATNALGIPGLQAVTRFGYDAAGNQTNLTDALNRSTAYVYDALNRRTDVIFSDGTRQTTGYDALGHRTSETDQATNTTRYAYDGLGRLTHVTNALGHVTGYSYDEAGNQLTQTDARTNMTRFEYDSLGRRIKRITPGGEFETFGYDSVGNMIAHTNFNGLAITNKYDAVNRLISRRVGTNSQVLESYGYSASGQRTNMVDASGSYSYVYDQRDRLKTNAMPQGTLRYTYDANGNVLAIKSSTLNGIDLTYQYDALNRLTNVIDANLIGTPANNTVYAFDAVGSLQRYSYPNGLTNLYQFDSLNRLTNLTWKAGASARADFAYRLGPAGHRTNLSETIDGTLRGYTWSYDALYRLTGETISGASPSGTIGYNYDPVGNRTNRAGSIGSLAPAAYTYGSNDWLAADFYDKNGNTTNSAGGTYRYDYANRLTNYVNGTTNVSITYNADGNRVSKTVGGTTTLYLVDVHNLTGYSQVLEELTVSGGTTNLAKAYTYGLDLISQRQISPLLITFYGYDGHGSVRFLTATNGAVTDAYTYDAYGTLLITSGTTPNVYLHAGEQWDIDLNRSYNRDRYLDLNNGRFLTADKFPGFQAVPFSLNRYVYAYDDPVNNIDPSGLETLAGTTVTTTGAAGLAMTINTVVANATARLMFQLTRAVLMADKAIFYFEAGATLVAGGTIIANGAIQLTANAFEAVADMTDKVVHSYVNNTRPVPGGWGARGVALEQLGAQHLGEAYLGGNVETIDVFEGKGTKVVASFKSHGLDPNPGKLEERYLGAITGDAQALADIDGKEIFGTKANGEPFKLPKGGVDAKMLYVAIPENHAKVLLKPTFSQALRDLAQKTRTIIVPVPVKNWRK